MPQGIYLKRLVAWLHPFCEMATGPQMFFISIMPFRQVRSWIDAALLFWAEYGFDRQHVGFLEEPSPEGRPTDVQYKRFRFMCRQVFVFSQVALKGGQAGADLSTRGYEYLAARRDPTRAAHALQARLDVFAPNV